MLLIGILVIVVGGLLTAFCLWTLRNPLAFVGFDKRSCGVESPIRDSSRLSVAIGLLWTRVFAGNADRGRPHYHRRPHYR